MLDILMGHESAALKSIATVDDAVVAEGEWIVFDSTTGKAKKEAGAWDPGTMGPAFPVFGGTSRLDSKYMESVTACFGKAYIAETDKYAAVTIKAGDPLTLADGQLTKATLTGNVVDQKVVGWALTGNASGRLQFVVR